MNVPAPSSTVVWNTNGILCSKKKHVSPHFLGMPEKCEEKVFLFRNLNLTLRNNASILYCKHCPRRALQLAQEFENRARMFVASHTQFKDKPDMIEVNTTYSWQIPHGVDAGVLCASIPATLSRTQSEFGLAWANEMSTSKQASKQANAARLRLTLRRPVVSHSRQESADLTLNHSLSGSRIGTRFSCLDAGSAKAIFNNHADMGVSTPVSAFFVSRNTSLPRISA